MFSSGKLSFPLVELAVFVLLLPVAMLAEPILLLFLLIVPVMWLIRIRKVGRPWPRTSLNLALYVILVMIAVSAWITPDLALSLPKIVGSTFGIFFFWGMVSFAGRSPSGFGQALVVYFTLALGIVAVSVIKTDWTAKISILSGPVAWLDRLSSVAAGVPLPEINANQVAGVLMWVTPLALGAAAAALGIKGQRDTETDPKKRLVQLWPVSLILVLFLLGVLILTQSRTGWAGFGFALLGMAWLAGGRWRSVMGLFVTLLIIGSGLVWLSDGDGSLGAQITSAVGLRSDALIEGDAIGTLNGRLEIWSRAIYGIQDFPITGMGMNVFREIVHVLYPLFLIPPTTDIAHAHNHLLQTGVDLGIPGLVAYLAVWLGAIGIIWRLWRSPAGRQPVWRALLIGFSGSLIAYWIYGIADTVALGAKPGFLWWGLLGLLVGLEKVVDRELKVES